MSSSYVPVESLLQSSAFRRLLVVSLVGHVLVYAFLVFRPSSKATLIAAAPVMVQMVDMPKAPAPPAPPAAKPPAPPPPQEKPKPPEPAPPPPPPPPKPVVKEIVIPKEPAPLPAKPKPKAPPPPSAEELIAKMTQRVEQQEATKAPPAPPAPSAPAAAPSGNTGAPTGGLPSAGAFDPLLSPWIARVQVQVRANWSGASVCEGRTNPVFNVDVDAGGHMSSIELSQSSGDRHCDDTGERALRKSDPLPPPPRPGQFELWLDAKVTQ